MAVTESVKILLQNRIATDRDFARALLCEGVEVMLAGDFETGKAILRDYIGGTVGFEQLGAAIGTSAKRLSHMFGQRGNPRADNIFDIIVYLQKQDGIELHVTTPFAIAR